MDWLDDLIKEIIYLALCYKRRFSMKDFLRYFIGVYGEGIGLAMVFVSSIWDVLRMGVRGFLEYKVGIAGVIVIWVGLILIMLSKRWDRRQW